jgi:hypothetical protein
MNIGIIEVAEAGHFTYVESMAQVYLAALDNKVIIFTTSKGITSLAHLQNERLSLVEVNPDAKDVFQHINQYRLDVAYVVTLEHTNKRGYGLIRHFLETDWMFPVHFVIHNIVFWTPSGILEQLKSVIYYTKNLKSGIYEIKKTFWYSRFNQSLIEKIFKTGGRLVVLSHAVANELALHFGREKVQIMPFSVYTASIPDRSSNNEKIRLCFPGYVSAVRRDYFSVLKLMEQPEIRERFAFDFLGGIASHEGGDDVVAAAKLYQNKGATIYLYEKPSVGIIEFDEQLSKADLIFGNLHVQVGFNSTYGKSKESGLLFTMIKAAKPGIVPADYPLEPALIASNLIFKDYEAVQSLLIELAKHPEQLIELKQAALVTAKMYAPEQVLKRL